MTLTPEVVEYAKKEVGIEQFYEKAETATPKHILFKEFTEQTKWKGLPKVIYYILMDELFPQAKAADGNLGYMAKLKTT